MKAIEVLGKIDSNGNLILNKKLRIRDKHVKVFILYGDKDDSTDKEAAASNESNPSFSFIVEEGEDSYLQKNAKR